MAIPNTTPTPNELYNGEMKKMSDTELRVVLVVTRATLGWQLDPKTGKRKEEDWISSSQIKAKTGRGSRAISTAIESATKKGWIEARDSEGNILDTPQKRSGKKIFYRLGRVFLDKIETPAESAEVKKEAKTPAESAPQPAQKVQMQNVHSTKEKHTTKEISTKDVSKETEQTPSYGREDINEILAYFSDRLSGQLDGSQKMNRRYAKLLIDKLAKQYPEHSQTDQIKFLIDAGLRDKFHAQHLTSMKYLYYNAQKIVQTLKNPKYIKI